jgi:hypothetical protein
MFDLSKYTTCQERLNEFWKTYPNGRIETELLEHTKDRFVVMARVFQTVDDDKALSTGLAQEEVGSSNINKNFALENCETSAISRCLANANIGVDKKDLAGTRASREEMEKVIRVEKENKPKPFAEKLAERITVPKEDDPWTIKTVTEAPAVAMSVEQVAKTIGATILKDDPTCLHGNRIWRTGVKNGKPWGMWACDARPMNGERFADVEKCDPMWMSLASDGTWKERI